jgi:hypothetical protein
LADNFRSYRFMVLGQFIMSLIARS